MKIHAHIYLITYLLLTCLPIIHADYGLNEGYMFKGRTFNQDVFHASEPTPAGVSWDFVCSGISDNTIVISLQPPGKPIEIQTNDSFGSFYFGNSYATQIELDSNYPDGKYKLTVKNAKGDSSVETIDISGSLYPAIPRISDILSAQCIDSAADFALTWDALAGGSTNDLLLVWIGSREDGTVFETPYQGNGMLNGSSTSVTIPKNTLKPGIFYQVAIRVERTVVAQQVSNPGVYKISGYYSQLNSSKKPFQLFQILQIRLDGSYLAKVKAFLRVVGKILFPPLYSHGVLILHFTQTPILWHTILLL